jgi:predicted ATP-binding protein involved in virulence
MQIRELALSNYRAFSGPHTFRFGEQFTVIAGVNGRGKTAILDALALLFSHLLPLVTPARREFQTMRPTDVYEGASTTELAVKIRWPSNTIEYKLVYDKGRRRSKATRLSGPVKKSLRAAHGDPLRVGDAAPIAIYYSTDRSRCQIPSWLPTEVPHGQELAYKGALSSHAVNFRDFMARFRAFVVLENERRSENPSFAGGRIVEASSKAIRHMLDGFENLRVEDNPLRLLIDKEGVPLDLTQLSDGERSFLAVVCDLVRRLALANPSYPDPLVGEGVVLIDELELHLHPRWQREVVEKLRNIFPKIQFIATTHSPFVIQSLMPGELINLDPEEFGELGEYSDKSIEDIAENVMGVELPQKSERYQRMMEAAEEYFRLLREMPSKSPEEIKTAEQRLNELAAPFSDDPAFQALLKIERETESGSGGDETR